MFEKQPIIDAYLEMIVFYENQGKQHRADHYRAMLQVVEDASIGIHTFVRVDGKPATKQQLASFMQTKRRHKKIVV